MRHRLDPSHVRPKRGRAFGYEFKHPSASTLPEGSEVGVWWQGQRVDRAAGSRREVEKEGRGLVYFEPPYVWLSLPGDVDPSSGSGELLLEFPSPQFEDGGPTEQARPLLIVCQQRSGSTALLYALGEVGPYRGPLQWHVGTETEGYWQWQCLREALDHPLLCPFGDHGRGIAGVTGSMGLFDRSGLLDPSLRDLATAIHRSYSRASATRGTWIDKSPGFEVVPVAALFAALFPRGRILFLTREPVACVLSGVRLEGRSAAQTTGPSAWLHVMDVAARWTVSHYLWRRYARPWLPPERFLEVSAHDMAEDPGGVLDSVRGLLDLEVGSEQLRRCLDEVPVPRWSGGQDEYTKAVRSLVAAWTRVEAAEWGHAAAAPTALSRVLRPRFHRSLRRKLQYVGLHQEAAREAADWLCGARANPPPAPARPGAWLGAALGRS